MRGENPARCSVLVQKMKRYKLWAPTWLKELGWAPEVGGVQDGWMVKKSKKAKQTCSVLLWHKTTIKRIRQRFGLSKYQMLWITFGKGLLIGYVLALLVHR